LFELGSKENIKAGTKSEKFSFILKNKRKGKECENDVTIT
jgi:hypothetical protein